MEGLFTRSGSLNPYPDIGGVVKALTMGAPVAGIVRQARERAVGHEREEAYALWVRMRSI